MPFRNLCLIVALMWFKVRQTLPDFSDCLNHVQVVCARQVLLTLRDKALLKGRFIQVIISSIFTILQMWFSPAEFCMAMSA